MGKLKICMLSAETYPYAKVGGLGDVVSALAAALVQEDAEVRILSPLYFQVDRSLLKRQSKAIEVPMGDRSYTVTPYADDSQSPSVNYFIEGGGFFERPGIYDDPISGQGYPDNFERFNLFTLAALKAVESSQWKPDLFHCHDTHTALLPAYLKLLPEIGYLRNTPTLLTIHNLAYQGIYAKEKFSLTGLPEGLFYPMSPFEFYGQLNTMKAGILHADVINTVSPRYAQEIQEEEMGCGLAAVLRERRSDLYGVLNGIDTQVWDPESDPLIFAHFSRDERSGKKTNLTRLRELSGLPELDVPLIAVVSRLVDQKGIDLILAIEDEIKQMDCQWVVLGKGTRSLEKELGRIAAEIPDHFSVHLEFSDRMAHRIEAGADIFVMPSRYEPCGLNQMYSMRYGTVPVVRSTAGWPTPCGSSIRKMERVTASSSTITPHRRCSKQSSELWRRGRTENPGSGSFAMPWQRIFHGGKAPAST